MKRPTVAICYDFDGTLAPLNMQEYGFFLSLPEEKRMTFWKESHELARKEGADPILCYVKSLGGTSIAVYNPKAENPRATADRLFLEGRVNYVIPADYAADSLMDKIAKRIIDKVAVQAELDDAAQAAIPR